MRHNQLFTKTTFLFIFLSTALIFPQTQPSLSDFLGKIADERLNMDEKYIFNKNIDHLSIPEQITILRALTNWAKKEKDKDKLITLYSMINVHYRNLKEIETGKMYLDSALSYIDQTSNVDALGALYYQMGSYFYYISDIETAHAHYYKAIEYYEQSETKQVILSMVYYRIGSEYLTREDTLSTGKIVSKILKIKLFEPYKIYYDNIYTFTATYYQLKAEKETERKEVYLDSTLLYLRKSIDIFNQYAHEAPNPSGARRIASQNHYNIAKILLERDSVDLAWKHLKKGERCMSTNDSSSTQGLYHEIKGKILMKKNDLHGAEIELKKAEHFLKSINAEARSRNLNIIYASLATLYLMQEQYKMAYDYKQEENKLLTKINDTERYNIIKELETKHEVEKKEQHIHQLTQLNEYQQKIKYLYVGIIFLVITLLFFIIIWFLNKRKSDAALLSAAHLKQQETELKAALETVKLEEREREYQILLNKTQQRQIKSYLEGLEAERSRLARDLHDVVSNEFIAINLQITQTDFNKEALNEKLHSLHQKVRSISHALMPPIFRYATFGDIIENYIQQQQEYFRGNITINIEHREAWDNLSPTISLDIYRIIQEGLSNALKHAKATNINLQFGIDNNTFQILIEDDGQGYDLTAPSLGIGLRTMRERAENLSGVFSIISNRGQGTKLQISFYNTGISPELCK